MTPLVKNTWRKKRYLEKSMNEGNRIKEREEVREGGGKEGGREEGRR